MSKLAKKRWAARERRYQRKRYVHARGCIVCCPATSAVVIAEYTRARIEVGTVLPALGGWVRVLEYGDSDFPNFEDATCPGFEPNEDAR